MAVIVNRATLELIKSFEGLRLNAYRDAVGVWTIGWGHTAKAGPPVVTPGMTITEAEADAILVRDVNEFAADVAECLAVPVNENQFGALVSFCFNVGMANFLRSSVLSYTNTQRFGEVPARFDLWIFAGGRPLKGLVRRRRAEGQLYATPVARAA